MVIGEVYRIIMDEVRAVDQDAQGAALQILGHLYGITPFDVVVHKNREVPDDRWKKAVSRRKKEEPLALILGETYFYGRLFYAEKGVLIPRQDSEFLLQTVISRDLKKARVLELGVGSGALAVSVMLEKPTWEVEAVDTNPLALALTEKNASRYDVTMTLHLGDGFDGVEGSFDIIYANPPYISEEEMNTLPKSVVDFEPREALFGGVDGLDYYRKWTPKAYERLREGGFLAYEIGYDQGEAVMDILKECGFDEVDCQLDFAGHQRVVTGVKR